MNRWTVSVATQNWSICLHYLNSHYQHIFLASCSRCLFRFLLSVNLSIKLQLLVGKDTPFRFSESRIPITVYMHMYMRRFSLSACSLVQLVDLMKWQVNHQMWDVCIIYSRQWDWWKWSRFLRDSIRSHTSDWLALRCIGQWSLGCCMSVVFHMATSKYATGINYVILGLPCNEATASWPPHIPSWVLCSGASSGCVPLIFKSTRRILE